MSKFCFSTNEENYYGSFESADEAIAEAVAEGHDQFWVGKCEPPTQPEEYFCSKEWLDAVGQDDDQYGGEWCEDWNKSTLAQRDELDHAVRLVMAAWLDRHKLRPTFFNVVNATEFVMEDGVAQRLVVANAG